METRCRVELLGGLRVRQGDRVISCFQAKIGALLDYLAYYPHRPHLREALIDRLWPEIDPRAGRNNLSVSLSWIRRHLDAAGSMTSSLRSAVPDAARRDAPNRVNGVLLTDRLFVRLNPEIVTTDVAAFEAALDAAACAPDAAARATELEAAVAIYQGDLLPESCEDWVLPEREWLAQRFYQALRSLTAHLEELGEQKRAIDFGRRAVRADPLREEAHGDLMRLYAASGDPNAALRQYRELKRLLKEDLGGEPAAATRALAREIERSLLASHPPLDAAGRRAAAAPGGSRSRPRAGARGEIDTAEDELRLATLLVTRLWPLPGTTSDRARAKEVTHRLLQAMTDALLQYEGRAERVLDDGLLAVFGAPFAHEDDPERAIRAALAIRQAARSLGLGVAAGVHTGQIRIAGAGHGAMSGPAVILATRLQEEARPGEIRVSETTHRLTRAAFAFVPVPPGAGGRSEHPASFRVELALARPTKTRGIEGLSAELIGRDEELATLEDALRGVCESCSRVCSIIGEAAVGKSRLVSELKGASGERLLWLEGRCLELATGVGYGLIRDLLSVWIGGSSEADVQARADAGVDPSTPLPGDRLVAHLREMTEQGELDEGQVEEIGPALASLISARVSSRWDDWTRNTSPEEVRRQTLAAIDEFFQALARRRTVGLVCEDLHWADTLSLDAIAMLMDAVAGGRASLLLILLYRPDREHRCSRLSAVAAQKCPEQYTELRLAELTPSESVRLVEALLRTEDLLPALKERILATARGNPFFLEEVIHSLIAAGRICRNAGRWRARGPDVALDVPESIQEVILSRVDRLAPERKEVLRAAAVIGQVFPRRLLGQVTLPARSHPAGALSEHRARRPRPLASTGGGSDGAPLRG
jgi:DNA-binding SARP family transcriptional activator